VAVAAGAARLVVVAAAEAVAGRPIAAAAPAQRMQVVAVALGEGAVERPRQRVAAALGHRLTRSTLWAR